MEHPLHTLPPHRNEILAVARALLYTEQTEEAHRDILRAAFETRPALGQLAELAHRSLAWTSCRPQPRLKALARKLQDDSLFREIQARHRLHFAPAPIPSRMRLLPAAGNLPPLETVRDLSDWLRLEPEHLLWFADLRDRNRGSPASPLSHYHVRILAKPYGSIRLVEAPKQRLKSIQRQILHEILSPIPLHPAVHGFRKNRSILTFAGPHAGRDAVLRLDLQEFFPSISGSRVQALFRTLGYPEAVADLLGGLCTTTTPRRLWRDTHCQLDAAEMQRARILYARPHLPQGAPTSPAIANLCAFRLDRRLAGLAKAASAVYTRYADDLAVSGEVRFARAAGRFTTHAAAIAAEEGFSLHHRKTRLMRPSVRQHLAGLTLNAYPNLQRRDLDRLEAILTNCVRLGPETQNREGHPDFRSHLEGRVSFAEMIVPRRAAHLRALLAKIPWT